MTLATRPKPSVHDRKRQAGHHRHSRHYIRTYWPYLPMLMIVAIGLMVNSVWSGHGHVLGTNSDFSSASLLMATNADRQINHKASLSLNAELVAAAQAKANDMAVHDYWLHTSPSGKTPWDFITAAGYQYQMAGENLAYGFSGAADVVAGWMSSPEHRANMLNAAYQSVGFGVASSPNYQGKGPETVVVAEYAQPLTGSGRAFTTPPASAGSGVTSPTTELSAQPVARVQLLTGGQPTWSGLALAAITAAGVAIFVLRHSLRLRRLLSRSEIFLARHALLDIVIVAVVTSGFVLVHAAGVIR